MKRVAPTCQDRCFTQNRRCTAAANKLCRAQICDEDGFAAQAAALDSCASELEACKAGCPQ